MVFLLFFFISNADLHWGQFKNVFHFSKGLGEACPGARLQEEALPGQAAQAGQALGTAALPWAAFVTLWLPLAQGPVWQQCSTSPRMSHHGSPMLPLSAGRDVATRMPSENFFFPGV